MTDNTMLIVDDSRLSRMMIRNFAQEVHADWEFIEAVDGDDAINKSATEAVTWMTIDYNMPGMDGITLATTLRERFPNATIALVTANIQDSIRRQADEIGMQFIQKPITEDKIRTFIGG